MLGNLVRFLWRSVTKSSLFDWSPLETLDPDTHGGQRGKNDHGLHSHTLSLVVLWFGGEGEESHDILGHLGSGSWGSIIVSGEEERESEIKQGERCQPEINIAEH